MDQAPSDGPLVAFDFDGTLTWRDSLLAFFAWRGGRARYLLGMAALLPQTARYLIDHDRSRLKLAMVRRFLAGEPRERLEAETRRFADATAPRLLRPDALACWRDWRARGARLLIVTATPETIVAPFAAELGASLLIGSKLAFDGEGRVAGMDGANCRGQEKVVRIRAALGAGTRLAAAYGDSPGDRQMLALAAKSGYRVFTQRP